MAAHKITAKVTNAPQVEVEITISMTLYNWERLLAVVVTNSSYPSWAVADAIRTAIGKVQMQMEVPLVETPAS